MRSALVIFGLLSSLAIAAPLPTERNNNPVPVIDKAAAAADAAAGVLSSGRLLSSPGEKYPV